MRPPSVVVAVLTRLFFFSLSTLTNGQKNSPAPRPQGHRRRHLWPHAPDLRPRPGKDPGPAGPKPRRKTRQPPLGPQLDAAAAAAQRQRHRRGQESVQRHAGRFGPEAKPQARRGPGPQRRCERRRQRQGLWRLHPVLEQSRYASFRKRRDDGRAAWPRARSPRALDRPFVYV